MYRGEAAGLVDGADIVMIATMFVVLNAKAVVCAFDELDESGKERLRVMLSPRRETPQCEAIVRHFNVKLQKKNVSCFEALAHDPGSAVHLFVDRCLRCGSAKRGSEKQFLGWKTQHPDRGKTQPAETINRDFIREGFPGRFSVARAGAQQ